MATIRGYESSESEERLLKAAVALLKAAPNHELGAVKLNKGLFYLDLCYLLENGKTYTGAQYVALPNGPVVDDYKTRLIGSLREKGLAEQHAAPSGFGKPIKLLSDREFGAADEKVQRMASDINSRFAKMSAAAVSDYSHENRAWEISSKGKTNGQIDMNIALQQLLSDDWVEEDDWLEQDDAEFERIMKEPCEPVEQW